MEGLNGGKPRVLDIDDKCEKSRSGFVHWDEMCRAFIRTLQIHLHARS